MWHIFIDLDSTLFLRRDIAGNITEHQATYLETSLLGNLTSGVTLLPSSKGYQHGVALCNPLYHILHREFFSRLGDLFYDDVSFIFITAGVYDPVKTKSVLGLFFGANRLSRVAIKMSPFYSRQDLIIATGIDYNKATQDQRVHAMANGKSRIMQGIRDKITRYSQVPLAEGNFVLIDDNSLNRAYAISKGFQVIDPAAENYQSILNILIQALPEPSFSSPHRDQYCRPDFQIDSLFEEDVWQENY